jgi:hypothetical protein
MYHLTSSSEEPCEILTSPTQVGRKGGREGGRKGCLEIGRKRKERRERRKEGGREGGREGVCTCILTHIFSFFTLFRKGLVHRLDKDTSGVWLYGKVSPPSHLPPERKSGG